MPKAEYNRHFAEAEKRLPDFKQTLAAADRAGVRISKPLEEAIKATPNPADVVYFLAQARNPNLIRQLEENPAKIAEISRDLHPDNLRQRSADQETARQNELARSHFARMKSFLEAHPEAAKTIAAANFPIAPNVSLAIAETG